MMNLLVRTNSELVGQLTGKDNRVEALTQKYIAALESAYKMEKMAEEKDAEILKLKNQIENMRSSHICDDLIDLNTS